MYFKVKYANNKTEVLNLADNTKVGGTYKITGTNTIFKVLAKVHYKYTLEDLDILRVCTEGYESGDYYNICHRVLRALKSGIPNVRFSSYEKELIAMIIDHENIPEFKEALKRIVGDKYYEWIPW